MPRSTLALAMLVVVGTLALASSARADVLDDFERAQAAYEDQRYDEAAAIFEHIVDETPEGGVRTALVLESRKYLAASYLFLGRSDDALRQFEALLRTDPSYELDPIRFPREVLELFERVRTRLHDEAEAARRASQAAIEARAREAAARQERERARLSALRAIASEETVVEPRSRWVAAIPFGVGQFQNGRRRLGVAFAATEAALLVGSIGTFAWHRTLHDHQALRPSVNTDTQAFQRLETSLSISNWVCNSLLLATAVVGVLEAEIHLAPPRVRTRPRALPPELEEEPALSSPIREATPVSASLGIGPGHLRLQLRF